MLIEHIIELIAPHRCLGCSQEGPLLCYACCLQLPPAPALCYLCSVQGVSNGICERCRSKSVLTAIAARTPYASVARALVAKLKFDRAGSAAQTIAETCVPLVPNNKSVIITHVPTTSQRVRERGYDQAQRIARHVAKRCKLPCHTLLARQKSTRQVGANKAQRQLQLVKAFRARNTSLIQNKHILLIDDVITTGSSLQAAARALHDAGALSVEALVFARTPSAQERLGFLR